MLLQFKHFFLLFASLGILIFQLESCKKPLLLSKEKLSFSVDTLVFDTVFTTIGSTTQSFKIYNTDSKPIQIESVELMGGTSSPFRLNLDGISGTKFADVEVLAKDSLFAFVEVTLDVNNQNLPLIIEDSVRFRSNGQDQYVRLAVWGQDMYFHYQDTVQGVWPNDKPHVVYSYTMVEPGTQLTIQEKTNVYFHKNALLFVGGSLQVNGSLDNEVTFQGDRLEADYDDVAGQWFGIYFGEASASTINYAIIKNATSGIQMFSNNSGSNITLTLTNSIVQNNSSYGVFLYRKPKFKAENCVIAKNGVHSFLVIGEAEYELNHCTLVGYGGASQTPAVAIRNYFVEDGTTYFSNIPKGEIVNSVIYGSLSSELVFDTINPNNQVDLNFSFKNCSIKMETPSTHSMFQNTQWNQDPIFVNVNEGKFDLTPSSPLNGNAIGGIYFLPLDIKGNPRSNPADIGAFEK